MVCIKTYDHRVKSSAIINCHIGEVVSKALLAQFQILFSLDEFHQLLFCIEMVGSDGLVNANVLVGPAEIQR